MKVDLPAPRVPSMKLTQPEPEGMAMYASSGLGFSFPLVLACTHASRLEIRVLSASNTCFWIRPSSFSSVCACTVSKSMQIVDKLLEPVTLFVVSCEFVSGLLISISF